VILVADLYSLLGLAARVREVVSGEDFCFTAIRKQRARLIILATDAGANGAKKVHDKCAYYHVPLLVMGDRETLGRAIGKSGRTVIGVTSAPFAQKMLQSAGVNPVSQKSDHLGGDDI